MSSVASPEGEGGRNDVPVPYRERVEDLRDVLVAQGSLGLLLGVGMRLVPSIRRLD
mgnify:CR=1 FL=1